MTKYSNIEEIEIDSPVSSLKTGNDFSYKGTYINGYEEGTSKIKRFYKEIFSLDKVKEDQKDDCNYLMELENGKIFLLGFCNDGEFLLSNRFKKLL